MKLETMIKRKPRELVEDMAVVLEVIQLEEVLKDKNLDLDTNPSYLSKVVMYLFTEECQNTKVSITSLK